MTLPRVAALSRALLAWADQPGNARFLGREQEQTLLAALPEPRRHGQLPPAAWLLGTYRLGRGQARVLEGEAMGWDQVRSGVALLRSSLLLRCRRQGEGALSALQAAHAVAFGLALGDPGVDELAMVLAALADGALGDRPEYPAYVRSLAALRQGARPRVSPRLGPYREVLHAFHGDPQTLARAFVAILDHHLEQSTRGEFAEPAFSLLPAEVLAAKAVRALLGLPWAKVEHPLMFTNLLSLAPRTPWPADPLVAGLEGLLRRR